MTHNESQPDNALGVTDADREFARKILDDCSIFEEGIEDEEKLAQWVRNIRETASRPNCGVQTVQATRRQIAEAIADGWTNGNETYEAQNDIMRMRLDHAALAVLDLLASSPLPSADSASAALSLPSQERQ